MLNDKVWGTGLDYMEETWWYLVLLCWFEIITAKIHNPLSTPNKLQKMHEAQLL